MKTEKSFREHTSSDDQLRKAVKLSPIRKSGKERHAFYNEVELDDDDDALPRKKESAFDYFDDEE